MPVLICHLRNGCTQKKKTRKWAARPPKKAETNPRSDYPNVKDQSLRRRNHSRACRACRTRSPSILLVILLVSFPRGRHASSGGSKQKPPRRGTTKKKHVEKKKRKCTVDGKTPRSTPRYVCRECATRTLQASSPGSSGTRGPVVNAPVLKSPSPFDTTNRVKKISSGAWT